MIAICNQCRMNAHLSGGLGAGLLTARDTPVTIMVCTLLVLEGNCMKINRIKSLLVIGSLLLASAPLNALKHEVSDRVIAAVERSSEAINKASDAIKHIADKKLIDYGSTKFGYVALGIATGSLGIWLLKETLKDLSALGYSPKNIYATLFGKPQSISPNLNDDAKKAAEKEAKEASNRKLRLYINPILTALCGFAAYKLIEHKPSYETTKVLPLIANTGIATIQKKSSPSNNETITTIPESFLSQPCD